MSTRHPVTDPGQPAPDPGPVPGPVPGSARPGWLRITVIDAGDDRANPVADASLSLSQVAYGQESPRKGGKRDHERPGAGRVRTARTDRQGRARFDDLDPGSYLVWFDHAPSPPPLSVEIEPGCASEACFEIGLNAQSTIRFHRDDCTPIDCGEPRALDIAEVAVSFDDSARRTPEEISLIVPPGARVDPNDRFAFRWQIPSAGNQELAWGLRLAPSTGAPSDAPAARLMARQAFIANERVAQPVSGNLGVSLSRSTTATTTDIALWQAIMRSTERLSFNQYLRFMNALFCGDDDGRGDFDRARARFDQIRPLRLLPFNDADAYRVVKAATEAYVMVNCGIVRSPGFFGRRRDEAYLQLRDLPTPLDGLDDYLVDVPGVDGGVLPYLAVIRSKLPDISIKLSPIEVPADVAGDCHGILQEKLTHPCLLELVWSYWHEEGMLVQTIANIARRFQNVRGAGDRDPLANLEIDPLRPLSNLLWGYTLDEQHRLSVVRRNYEYDHHYGLRLEGKAVPRLRGADSRSRFIEAFHNLLRVCAVFYRQDDDTTVKADAFPVLNALKDVHLILSQGAHNQFGDLPSTARIEMLLQQWLLARPEFREFLPTRIMVAYPEPWMDRVDAMKKLQGWTDTSVIHFRNLAVFGEQVLLSIRWGHWSDVQEPLQAFNWARFFRPQIQGYVHAYRSATGVDLTAETIDAKAEGMLPSILLQRRLSEQQRVA